MSKFFGYNFNAQVQDSMLFKVTVLNKHIYEFVVNKWQIGTKFETGTKVALNMTILVYCFAALLNSHALYN